MWTSHVGSCVGVGVRFHKPLTDRRQLRGGGGPPTRHPNTHAPGAGRVAHPPLAASDWSSLASPALGDSIFQTRDPKGSPRTVCMAQSRAGSSPPSQTYQGPPPPVPRECRMPWWCPARPGWRQQPPPPVFQALGPRGSPSAALSQCPSFSLLLLAHQLNVAPRSYRVFTSSRHQPVESAWQLAPGPSSQERTGLAPGMMHRPTAVQSAEVRGRVTRNKPGGQDPL